jgi:hypothetical protein
MFLTDIDETFTISGFTKMTAEVAASKDTGVISAMLLEWGSNFVKIVAIGSVDIRNPNPDGTITPDVPGLANTSKGGNWHANYLFQSQNIVPYGAAAPTAANFNSYTWEMDVSEYTFTKGNQLGLILFGSDPEFTYMTHDPAEFTVNIGPNTYLSLPLLDPHPEILSKTEYTVTFVDYDGTVLSEQQVLEGASATAPDAPVREGYTFCGWDVDFTNIAGKLTVMAMYEINKYTVTFLADGVTVSTQSIAHGSAALAPDDPVKTGYSFIGWDKDFTNIIAALTVNAIFEINYYDVVFLDWDGLVLDAQSIAYGSAAQAPKTPVRQDWIFTGWDREFSFITGNLTVTALYDPTIIGLSADAYVKKLSGNMNALTITVTEFWSDGTKIYFTETFSISNNAADTYKVGDYSVYVNTKGNDQIRECRIVR